MPGPDPGGVSGEWPVTKPPEPWPGLSSWREGRPEAFLKAGFRAIRTHQRIRQPQGRRQVTGDRDAEHHDRRILLVSQGSRGLPEGPAGGCAVMTTNMRAVGVRVDRDAGGAVARLTFSDGKGGFGPLAFARPERVPGSTGPGLMLIDEDGLLDALVILVGTRAGLRAVPDFSGLTHDADGLPEVFLQRPVCPACGTGWDAHSVRTTSLLVCPRCQSLVHADPSRATWTGPRDMLAQALWGRLAEPDEAGTSLPGGLALSTGRRGAELRDDRGNRVAVRTTSADGIVLSLGRRDAEAVLVVSFGSSGATIRLQV